jgi:hypothetical protein
MAFWKFMLITAVALFLIAVAMHVQKRTSRAGVARALAPDDAEEPMTTFARRPLGLSNDQARHLVNEAFHKPRDY